MSQLDFGSPDPFERAISPFEEMAAYEALWSEKGATFKTIADKFREAPEGAVPSDLLAGSTITAFKTRLKAIMTTPLNSFTTSRKKPSVTASTWAHNFFWTPTSTRLWSALFAALYRLTPPTGM